MHVIQDAVLSIACHIATRENQTVLRSTSHALLQLAIRTDRVEELADLRLERGLQEKVHEPEEVRLLRDMCDARAFHSCVLPCTVSPGFVHAYDDNQSTLALCVQK